MNNLLLSRYYLISALLTLQFAFGNAQQPNYITGKVINSVTSEPIVFATLGLKNNHIGVFANAEGDFKISNSPNFHNDSLIVTSIGLNRTAIAFKDLKTSGQDQVLLMTVLFLPEKYISNPGIMQFTGLITDVITSPGQRKKSNCFL